MKEQPRCKNCNEELEEGLAFCPACGIAISEASPETDKGGKSPADKSMGQAFVCFIRSDFENALKFANEAIRLDPSNIYCHEMQGQAFCELGRYNEAVKSFDEAIKLEPSNARWHHFQGDAYFKLERYDKALRSQSEAIKLEPSHPDYHYGQGLAYFYLKRYNEAADSFNNAIKLDPRNAVASWREDSLAKLKRNEDTEELVIPMTLDSANYHYWQGNTYWELGRYREAADSFSAAIKLNPSNAIPRFNLGQTYFKLGKYSKAITAYSAAIKRYPSNAYYHYCRGYSLVMRGCESKDSSDLEMAIADFNRVLVLDPNYKDAQEAKKSCEDELAKMQTSK